MSVYIIAEAGCEHLGDIEKAKRMIDIAKDTGCNAIKFQHFYSNEINNGTKNGEILLRKIEDYGFSIAELVILRDYADDKNINCFCSAFGISSLKTLKDLGFKTVKIPSCCNENQEMLNYAVDNFDTVFLSDGMSNSSGLICPNRGFDKMRWLLCTSAYPCPDDAVNLLAMSNNLCDGLSDHTIGSTAAVMAVALGAQYIEKHITISEFNGGPDAHIALEPTELMDFVYQIRRAEKMLGTGVKKIEECEKPYLWRKNNE